MKCTVCKFLFVLYLCCIQLFKTSVTTTIPLYVQVARTKVLGVFNPRRTRDSGAWGLEEVRIIEFEQSWSWVLNLRRGGQKGEEKRVEEEQRWTRQRRLWSLLAWCCAKWCLLLAGRSSDWGEQLSFQLWWLQKENEQSQTSRTGKCWKSYDVFVSQSNGLYIK